MLKSPKELQAAAKRAAEQKAAEEAKSAGEREQLERLRKEFEATCLAAALCRRSRTSFDAAVSKVVDLRGFAVEEINRDRAREQFLASKMAEAEKQVALKLEDLAAAHPALVTKAFPNRLAKDFRGLVDRCINQETAEEVVEGIKRHLCLVTSLGSDMLWRAARSTLTTSCSQL
jgi:hypothetical protein